MPRPRNYPHTTDFTQKIQMTDLHRWGYLRIGSNTFNIMLYNPHTGAHNGTINCEIDMNAAGGYLKLSYYYNQICYNCRIEIESVKSNLCNGNYFLFKCPLSGKRTKTMYWVAPYFAHRNALGIKYETQYTSGPFGPVIPFFKNQQRVARELSKPYRKKIYANTNTRWYKKALKSYEKNNELGSFILSNIRPIK